MSTLAFFFMIDPMYFLYMGPAILLAMWAQMKVKSAYALAGRHKARSGLSGAETAQRILNAHGIADVAQPSAPIAKAAVIENRPP